MSNLTNYVFALDAKKKPLAPCKPGMARSLLKAGKASVFRRYPFTIILKKSTFEEPMGLQLKIDPGSKQTGFALLTQSEEVILAMVWIHRGQQIKNAMLRRRTIRQGRRNRNVRPRLDQKVIAVQDSQVQQFLQPWFSVERLLRY